MTGLNSAKYSSTLEGGSAIELAYFSVDSFCTAHRLSSILESHSASFGYRGSCRGSIEVHIEAMSTFLFGLDLLSQPYCFQMEEHKF